MSGVPSGDDPFLLCPVLHSLEIQLEASRGKQSLDVISRDLMPCLPIASSESLSAEVRNINSSVACHDDGGKNTVTAIEATPRIMARLISLTGAVLTARSL